MADADGAAGLAAWAGAHGLSVEDGARLPRTTPLLAEGEVHSVDALIGGWLSKYVEAKIALVSRGDDESFTVAVTHVPKAKRFVPWMLCHRVEDEGLLGRAAAALVGEGDRVELGSAELDACYRVYAALAARRRLVPRALLAGFHRLPDRTGTEGIRLRVRRGDALCQLPWDGTTLGEDLDALCACDGRAGAADPRRDRRAAGAGAGGALGAGRAGFGEGDFAPGLKVRRAFCRREAA